MHTHLADALAALTDALASDLAPRTRLALLAEGLAAALDLPTVQVEAELPAPAAAQLLAELCNWAAKALDEGFYAVKPLAWVLAVELGAEHGWGDDGAHYLSTPEGGVSCAHDPFGEIDRLVPFAVWPHPWSGVRRQNLAPDLVVDRRLRRLVALATRPDAHPCAVRAVARAVPTLVVEGV